MLRCRRREIHPWPQVGPGGRSISTLLLGRQNARVDVAALGQAPLASDKGEGRRACRRCGLSAVAQEVPGRRLQWPAALGARRAESGDFDQLQGADGREGAGGPPGLGRVSAESVSVKQQRAEPTSLGSSSGAQPLCAQSVVVVPRPLWQPCRGASARGDLYVAMGWTRAGVGPGLVVGEAQDAETKYETRCSR